MRLPHKRVTSSGIVQVQQGFHLLDIEHHQAAMRAAHNAFEANMTTTTLNPIHTTLLRGLWARFQEIRERRATYRATLNELGRLNDRELSDIGIHRCDIRRIAEDAYRR